MEEKLLNTSDKVGNREVTLRELIEIILEYKTIIIAITISIALIAGLYTYIIQEDKYVAESTLSVRNATVQTESLSSIDDIVNYMKNYPIITTESYVEQILTPQIILDTIYDLELKDNDNNYISISSLIDKVEVYNVGETDLITIKTTYSDAETAANISNTIGSKFIIYTNEKNRVQSQLAADEIEKQLILEEAKVEVKSKAVSEYIGSNTSIDELTLEVNSLIDYVTSIKTNINTLNISIDKDEEILETLLSVTDLSYDSLVGIELNLSTGMVSNELYQGVSNENDLQTLLLTMELTDVETRLISNRAELKAKETKLVEMQSRLITLQTTLAEQEYKYNSLTRDLDLAKQTYNAYQSRHKEAIVAAAANVGTNSILISSEALIPSQRVSPNRQMNVLMGIIIGLFIGIFIAMFMAYWKSSE